VRDVLPAGLTEAFDADDHRDHPYEEERSQDGVGHATPPARAAGSRNKPEPRRLR